MKRIFRDKFNATHFIKDHEKCGQPHSHQYELKVLIDSELEWYDFHTIEEQVLSALADIGIVDHTENDLGAMTCEKLARSIYNSLVLILPTFDSIKVELFETDKFGVEYP